MNRKFLLKKALSPRVGPGFAAIARPDVDCYDADLDVDGRDEDFDGDDDNWAGTDFSVWLEIGVGGHCYAPILKTLDAV